MMRLVALPLVVSILASGCSFVAVRGASIDEASAQEPECTESNLIPVFDALLTAASIAGTVNEARDNEMPGDVMPAGPLLATIALGFGISSAVGLWRTHTCREAKQLARSNRPLYQGAPPAPRAW